MLMVSLLRNTVLLVSYGREHHTVSKLWQGIPCWWLVMIGNTVLVISLNREHRAGSKSG